MIVKIRYSLLFLLMLFVSNVTQAMCSTECNVCSHTTFIPRTMAQNSILELALHEYYTYHRPECQECPAWLSVQVTAPYYFKSTNDRKLAEYFLSKCKDCIIVGQNNSSDVSSLWLNIAANPSSPFSSTLCLAPQRTVIGGAFRLFFDFSSWFGADDCGCNNWWASIFIPIQQVRHNLHITETISPDSGIPVPPSFETVISALNNPAWNYGKLSPQTLKRTGVDDISIKIGYDTTRDATKHAGIYALVFVPTGKGTKADYLFEPLVGSRHVGLGLGFNADALLYGNCDRTIDLMFDARYAHFFKRKEIRSIDLFNGDWSRYLSVVTQANGGQQLIVSPGINAFTQEVTVDPRGFFEVWAGISFNQCNWHFEVGYDFWTRAKERLSLNDQDLGVGILDFVNTNILCPSTAHCARICQAVPTLEDAPASDYPAFITVKNSERVNEQGVSVDENSCNGFLCSQQNQCSYVRLNSAAHPRALSSTVYAALSWDGCMCCNTPVMIGVGGQYEFAHRNALSQYGVWLKTAISF